MQLMMIFLLIYGINGWHKTLAHEQESITTFGKQFLVLMAKGKSTNPYDYCLFGKQHRVSFQMNSTQKLDKLELV